MNYMNKWTCTQLDLEVRIQHRCYMGTLCVNVNVYFSGSSLRRNYYDETSLSLIDVCLALYRFEGITNDII